MLQNNTFDLQIIPGSIPPVLHMAQYDSGRQFTATLKNGSANYSVAAGATAKIKGFNAAGVAWEQEATISGSTVIFTPSGAATDQFGVMPVTIEITVSEEVITPLLVVFDVQRAGYTNEEAVRSPEFQTAIEAAVAAAIEEGGLGFSDDFKEALLACFAHVAWTDEHGQDYYDALEDALYPGPAPVTLVSITAAYEQDRGIYNTDPLDVVKLDLTVTAHYSDDTSEVVTNYTLSGTLTPGTSTVTVSYLGKSTTIEVIVQDMMINDILTLDGVQNTRAGHDSSSTTWEDLSGNGNDFTKKTGANNAVWGTNHAAFDATNRQLELNKNLFGTNTSVTIEIVAKIDGSGSSGTGGALFGGVFGNMRAGSQSGGFGTYSYNSGGISSFYGSTSTGYTSASASAVYIAYVFANNTATRYVNGVANTPVTLSTFSTDTKRSDFIIGSFDGTGTFLNGKIYRIGMSAQAMTAQEIADRYAFYKTRFGMPD